MRVRRFTMIALILTAAVQAGICLPKMPSRMASHFNGSGVPNGWSSPPTFFALMLAIAVLVGGVFFFVNPLGRLSDDKINLPNKAYWLAPERRNATLERFAKAMLEFGIMTQLLLLYTVHLTVEANLTSPPLLSPHIVTALWLYVLATILWLGGLAWSFTKPGQ